MFKAFKLFTQRKLCLSILDLFVLNVWCCQIIPVLYHTFSFPCSYELKKTSFLVMTYSLCLLKSAQNERIISFLFLGLFKNQSKRRGRWVSYIICSCHQHLPSQGSCPPCKANGKCPATCEWHAGPRQDSGQQD